MRRTLAITVSLLLIALLVIVIWISNHLDIKPVPPVSTPVPVEAPPR